VNKQLGWQINDVHKAMEAVDPVVKVVFRFGLIARFMGDSGDLDRWEEVFVKMSTLGVVLSEAVLMEDHEMMEQGVLFIPQESQLMKFVEDVRP
jgi:hypothetical protein